MRGITLFAGGGLADIGLRSAGIRTVVAIEREQWIAHNFKINFPETRIICADCNHIDFRLFQDYGIQFLWASPPCQDASNARRKDLKPHRDRDAGLAIIDAVEALKPRVGVIENVPPYLKTPVYQQIRDRLFALGYWVSETIVNAADFGVPQNRKRLIVRFCNNGFIRELRGTTEHMGWYQAIADLIPTFPLTKLADWQLARIAKLYGYEDKLEHDQLIDFWRCNHQDPCLLPRVGCRTDRTYSVIDQNLPSPTLRALGHDRQWRQLDIFDGVNIRKLTPEGEMRLQTMPDDYLWMSDLADWQKKKIIGNGVSCKLAQAIAKS